MTASAADEIWSLSGTWKNEACTRDQDHFVNCFFSVTTQLWATYSRQIINISSGNALELLLHTFTSKRILVVILYSPQRRCQINRSSRKTPRAQSFGGWQPLSTNRTCVFCMFDRWQLLSCREVSSTPCMASRTFVRSSYRSSNHKTTVSFWFISTMTTSRTICPPTGNSSSTVRLFTRDCRPSIDTSPTGWSTICPLAAVTDQIASRLKSRWL